MFDMRFHYNTSSYSGTACVVLGDDWVHPDIQDVSTDEARSNKRIDTTMLQRLAELSNVYIYSLADIYCLEYQGYGCEVI